MAAMLQGACVAFRFAVFSQLPHALAPSSVTSAMIAPAAAVEIYATGDEQAAVIVDLDRGVPAVGEQSLSSIARLRCSHALSDCTLNSHIAQSIHGTPQYMGCCAQVFQVAEKSYLHDLACAIVARVRMRMLSPPPLGLGVGSSPPPPRSITLPPYWMAPCGSP